MKLRKLMALMLAGTLAVASLAGCGSSSSDDSSSDTEIEEVEEEAEEEEVSEAEEVAEEVTEAVEEADTGDIVKVGYVPLMTSTDFHLELAEAIVRTLNENGYEADYTSPDSDISKQIEIVENYVAMGYDCIILFPLDGDALSNVVDEAMDAGVKVIVMVNETERYNIATVTDNSMMAEAVLELATEWVEETFPDAEDGSIECAFISYYMDDNTKAYSEKLAEIEDYCSKVKLVVEYEEPDEEQATGQSIAENLYIQYPDVKLFICTSGTVALGVNAYYTSMDSPVDDLHELGAFSINANQDTYAAILASATDEAMYRGVGMSTSSADETGEVMLGFVNGLNDGTYTGEGILDYTAVIKVTADNVEDYIEE